MTMLSFSLLIFYLLLIYHDGNHLKWKQLLPYCKLCGIRHGLNSVLKQHVSFCWGQAMISNSFLQILSTNFRNFLVWFKVGGHTKSKKTICFPVLCSSKMSDLPMCSTSMAYSASRFKFSGCDYRYMLTSFRLYQLIKCKFLLHDQFRLFQCYLNTQTLSLNATALAEWNTKHWIGI